MNDYLSNQDVDQQDDSQALVHCPHGVTHEVRELQREDGAVLHEFLLGLNPCVFFCITIKNLPEDMAEHFLHACIFHQALIPCAVE